MTTIWNDIATNTETAADGIFLFEQDFAGSLRCIPMVMRLKLDLCAIKLSLRQWSQLSRENRHALMKLGCDTPQALSFFHDRLIDLIEQYCDEPPKKLQNDETALWRETSSVPSCVLAQARNDAVSPPEPETWQALSPLQRFALVKLARSKHENENFVPAMREFGLLGTA